jgi:hypothetical protein
MTKLQTEIFAELDERGDDSPAMLDAMIDHFRRTRQPVQLFEALKMRVRHRAGLPLIAGEDEVTRPDDVERQLEQGLLDACRETGAMLLEDGKVREGWMYLRPTGDVELARRLMGQIEIDDDNYDDMIQVLLHEGIDIGRGFQAVIDHQGTCNSITLYEQGIASRSKGDRRAAAARLVDHLYDELRTLVREDITRRDAAPGDEETLAEMIGQRRWVLGEGGYHLDTTHIAAVVRIATALDDRARLTKAWELTQYGRQLDPQFQYPGEEPFVDFYPAYAAFYTTLLGKDVESGLRLFERKARSVDVGTHGTGAIETYIDLLERVGRPRQALEAALELVPDDVPPQRIVPHLLDLAANCSSPEDWSAHERILDYCRRHNDVLGYAAVRHAVSRLA